MAHSPAQLNEQVCFALYSASRAVTSLYRPILDELGLTYPQYLVMLVLWERESMIVKDLGTALQLDTGTLSPLLKRMESNGLISRRRRQDDERSVDVTPTEHGWALQDRARSVPTRLVTALDLSGAELAELRDTLHRITATALDHLVGAGPRQGAE